MWQHTGLASLLKIKMEQATTEVTLGCFMCDLLNPFQEPDKGYTNCCHIPGRSQLLQGQEME